MNLSLQNHRLNAIFHSETQTPRSIKKHIRAKKKHFITTSPNNNRYQLNDMIYDPIPCVKLVQKN